VGGDAVQERAAVLRRAGEGLQRHTDELRDWLVRETGSVTGKAYFELHMAFELRMAVQECYEAAALPFIR
jgi:benzaldehyde dehydrogenase (NAD)